MTFTYPDGTTERAESVTMREFACPYCKAELFAHVPPSGMTKARCATCDEIFYIVATVAA